MPPVSKTNNSNRMTTTNSYFIFLGCVLYTIIALYALTFVIVKDNPTKNNETNMQPVTTTTIKMKKTKNNKKSKSNSSFASVIEKDNKKNKTSLSSLSVVVSKDVNIIKKNTNDNNNKKKKNKFILIHIGPSKTGTTTIQMDATTDSGFIQALQQDNTMYVGKFLPGYNRYSGQEKEWYASIRCMELAIFGTKTNYETTYGKSRNHEYGLNDENYSKRRKKKIRMPLIQDESMENETKKDIIEKCWQGTTMKKMIEMNIIDSDEGYSYQLDKLQVTIQMYHTIFLDYLDYDELIIVGAYRRYFDWLPSTYKERMKKAKKVTDNQPMWPFLWDHFIQRPNWYNTGIYTNIHQTLQLARNILPGLDESLSSSSFSSNLSSVSINPTTATTKTETLTDNSASKVEILNYFQLPNENYYNSISTELYCKVLGMDRTPNTCVYSHQKGADISVHHKGKVDDIPYKLIMKEVYQRGWLSAYPSTHKKYDATMSYSNSRIQTWTDLQEYHTQLLLKTHNNDTGDGDGDGDGDDEKVTKKDNLNENVSTTTTTTTTTMIFPLLCPTNLQLETFLVKSLQFEQLVMPEFYNTHLGEVEHNKSFWKMAGGNNKNGADDEDDAQQQSSTENNPFCWIDIETLFGKASSWEEVLNERMTIFDNSW